VDETKFLNFQFPTENKIVDIVLNNETKQLEEIKLMAEMKKMVENLDINAIDNKIIDNENEVAENNVNNLVHIFSLEISIISRRVIIINKIYPVRSTLKK
jgi:hypothetical protein